MTCSVTLTSNFSWTARGSVHTVVAPGFEPGLPKAQIQRSPCQTGGLPLAETTVNARRVRSAWVLASGQQQYREREAAPSTDHAARTAAWSALRDDAAEGPGDISHRGDGRPRQAPRTRPRPSNGCWGREKGRGHKVLCATNRRWRSQSYRRNEWAVRPTQQLPRHVTTDRGCYLHSYSSYACYDLQGPRATKVNYSSIGKY